MTIHGGGQALASQNVQLVTVAGSAALVAAASMFRSLRATASRLWRMIAARLRAG